ncbi:SIS domain-containing protein [Bacillus sp. FJAT-29790]|uniref:SIS domain-containing protein n=1 Tax=Bacillus sp. FJAT-29790 TaxID=1895002 RepID=UPI001C245127|nr:SIS domain-containing protein [Bacillus sp. FJAT-29790]MBU8880357.1 SIS domain-containing protein [Bacillus sp. FJAT-29790]
MFNQYFHKLQELLGTVEKDEKENIKKAAQKVAVCIQNNGIVHVFGCGHSHMIGEELFYRAGGLAPISPILIEDLMLHNGAVRSSQLEQKNEFVEQFIARDSIQSEDVVIVVSTSGRNPVPIDVAEIAQRQGAFVIAITSPSYANSQSSRHKNGKYLYHSVDLSIDNHIDVGDALMKHESLDVSFGSGSTIISMAIANSIMVEAVNIMLENDFSPPIFISGNTDGAEEHNRELINKYKSRIPMLER